MSSLVERSGRQEALKNIRKNLEFDLTNSYFDAKLKPHVTFNGDGALEKNLKNH